MAKNWSFSFSISPSNEYSGLVSFRIDWFDLLAVQGTLKSLLQHHSYKASILRCSAFIIVQLSQPHMTTGNNIALTRQTCFGKVMFLLFNMLSRLVIAFLPRTKSLNFMLQSPSAVVWEGKKIKYLTVSTVSPSICHEVMGPDAMILAFWMLSFKPTFSLSSFTCIKRLFSSSLSAIRVVSPAYLKFSRSVVSDSLWPHGLWRARLLPPWGFPGKSTGGSCHFLLQKILLTQGLNLGFPHCRQTLYQLSNQGRPQVSEVIDISPSNHDSSLCFI